MAFQSLVRWLKEQRATDLKKAQWAWTFTDWAQSAFSTTVAGVFLGPYLTALAEQDACQQNAACFWCSDQSICTNSITAGEPVCSSVVCDNPNGWCCDQPGNLYVAGAAVAYGSYYSFIVTASVIVQILLLPVVGALADTTKRPLLFLMLTTFFGSSLTILFLIVNDASLWWLGGLLFVLANVFLGLNSVFYDSFLNILAPPSERDTWSSRGFAVGYVGGGILLALNLIAYEYHPSALVVRINLASAGVWWAAFIFVPFAYIRKIPLEDDKDTSEDTKKHNLCYVGIMQFAHTFKVISKLPQTILFLVAALIYNDGIQTVISLASVYGQQALGLNPGQLAIIYLMVQFIAFFGAFLFDWIASKILTKWAISISLLIWIAVLIWTFFNASVSAFYGETAIIAVVLGGSQALSRGLFGRLIPRSCQNELYSFYEVSQRGTSWMGPLVYGATTQAYNNNPRPGILMLAVFFVAGLIILFFVDVPKGEQMAMDVDTQLQLVSDSEQDVSEMGPAKGDYGASEMEESQKSKKSGDNNTSD